MNAAPATVKITDSSGRLRTLADVEADVIRAALQRQPNRVKAASALRIGRSTLYRKLEQMGEL